MVIDGTSRFAKHKSDKAKRFLLALVSKSPALVEALKLMAQDEQKRRKA